MSTSAQNHVRIVSILTLIGGIVGLLPGLGLLLGAIGLTAFGGLGGSFEAMLAGGIMGIFALVALAIGLPAIVAGVGLLGRKRWARPLTIVIALINLVAFPLHTLLGIYQLWVLALNEETRYAYEHPQGEAFRDYAG